jgi:pyruvate kinase
MSISHGQELIATLGPASRDLARALSDAGATGFRLNASHMTPAELDRLAASVREAVPGCRLVVDLRGAKMRLGDFPERPVRRGASVHFSLTGAGGTIPLPHPEIFASVAVDESLGCDDDRLRFRVTSTAPGSLVAESLLDGVLRQRKGVNVIEHPVVLNDICESDLACIRATAHLGGVAFAFSFMKDGREAGWVRKRAPGCGIIGKIERREAAAAVHQIAGLVDQLWICRGDLGAQLGQPSMARWVSAFDPRSVPCRVLMAGQVLEHLTRHESPTRAEVCHLFDLVARGYAGFVLSDETAIGANPKGAVSTLSALLAEFQTGA